MIISRVVDGSTGGNRMRHRGFACFVCMGNRERGDGGEGLTLGWGAGWSYGTVWGNKHMIFEGGIKC